MLFTNATIITMNARREIILNGAIRTEGNRIADIGKAAELTARYPDEKVVDVEGKLIIPGLVNTHVHLAQSLLRGAADDLELIGWLCERVWVLQGNFTNEDGYAAARLTIAEMLKSGTTTFLEAMLAHRYGFDGIAEACIESGIRACLGGIVMDVGTYATKDSFAMHPGLVEDRETSLLGVLKAHDKWHGSGDDRVHVWFGARTPGGVTPELYREMCSIAKEKDMGITMHCAEVSADMKYCKEKYDLSPVGFAESVGMLGKKTVLVHMVWLEDEDMEKLRESGTHVSHNPTSNCKLASGICKVPELLDNQVNVCLGTDGAPCNNTYDMIREMHLAAILHKARTLDPVIVPAETALEMATINGAKALGLEDEIGSLEIGKKADLVVVDLKRLNSTPDFNPVSTLVYTATGGQVDIVVVDGKIVVEGGELKTMDEAEVITEANKHAREVAERAGLGRKLKAKWPLV
ncbi:amidohydrolase [Basidiobolus meristosporus CBS 931.73]|uniref:Amidohydrolase n=1 Tax=Basidiobolus meristosporus CBS 931.73 TaxID=1314790 RepID=A0A1Y1Z0L1_9FUNG|nr:amidohydrolase [Basidiobolus meristosporus CBS 931.73]|eukprot:ORY03716.1 amidohydrolase [Basidiobolus meristosporus CBS 931.73]